MLYANHRITKINKNAPEYIAHLMSEEYQELLAAIARKHCAEIWHKLNQSKNEVERVFNKMAKEKKDVILAYADIRTSDLLDPYSKGRKLGDYTPEGQDKIAEAVKKIREIANEFPPVLTKANFKQIDKEVNYAKSTY
ncbi:hypothetical protein [Aggregatibacter kilianii]|uniref:hypothetical protein n=1 Tax=Aggregatibacter kilianii TaxID=2025884 RepID=UPI000D64E328|nr:hypothetical protein [Aggregatibacter kilianii]